MTSRRLIENLRIHIPILIKATLLASLPLFYGKTGFKKHLASIMITKRCNLRCIMCNQWTQKDSLELSTDEWKGVISKLKSAGISEIHFTGGEPLLRPDLCDIIRYASEMKFTIGMTTNGCLLTEKVMESLTNAGLSSIGISLDAIEDEYENIRGVKGIYNIVKKNLETISRYRSRGDIIAYVNFTLMKPSIRQFVNVKKTADELNIPVAICLLDDTPYCFKVEDNRKKLWLGKDSLSELKAFIDFIREEKNRKPKSLILTNSSIRYIERYFSDPIQKALPCVASQTRVFIGPGGEIFGGCLSMGTFGNMKNSDLKEIFVTKRLRQGQKNMFYKNCPGCSCGYLYNIRHNMPDLIKDLLLWK